MISLDDCHMEYLLYYSCIFMVQREPQAIFKSPRYTGGDYVFVLVRTPPPAPAAASCPRDNFWTTFRISFIQINILFLARLLALTCRLPD